MVESGDWQALRTQSALVAVLCEARVEAKNHKKLEDGLYRGTLRRGTHHAGCGCAVGEEGEEVHIQPITGT